MAYIESKKLELKVQYTTEIKKEIVAFLNKKDTHSKWSKYLFYFNYLL